MSGVCNKTSNNKFFDCPPRMDDGRHFTDYRPNSYVNDLIRYSNKVMSSYNARQFLQANATVSRVAGDMSVARDGYSLLPAQQPRGTHREPEPCSGVSHDARQRDSNKNPCGRRQRRNPRAVQTDRRADDPNGQHDQKSRISWGTFPAKNAY